MEAIGQLAGGVAHDFNNLLTAIIGYGHLLKNEASKDDRMSAYVGQILSAAERAAILTNDLLTFSRKQIINPQAGKSEQNNQKYGKSFIEGNR